LYTFNLIKTG